MAKKLYRFVKIALEVLLSNPKFFVKRVAYILKSGLFPVSRYPAIKMINGIAFKLNFEDCSPLKKMIYYDMYEMGVVEAIRAILREGDTFIDVGANIGYITAIGASLVGKNGRVYSFEPVTEYFLRLNDLAELNKGYKITANQLALSDRAGNEKIYLSDYSNIGANSILLGLMEKDKIRDVISVKTCRLDEYIEKEKVKNIKVIKIDTEGFEYPVLLGLKEFFDKCRQNKLLMLPVIVCEVSPPAYQILGYKLEDIFSYMKQFGYSPFSVINPGKELNIAEIREESTMNIIFKEK